MRAQTAKGPAKLLDSVSRNNRSWRSFSVAPTTAFLRRPALHHRSRTAKVRQKGKFPCPQLGRGFPPDRCRRPVFRQSDVNRVAQKERSATATRRFRQLPGDRLCSRRSPVATPPGSRTQTLVSSIGISRPAKYSIERSLLANRRRSVRPIRRSSYRRRPAAQKTRQAASVASRYERENSAGARGADRRRLRAACPVPRPGRRP